MATPVITGIRSPSMEMGETTCRTFRSPKWLVPSLPCVGEVYARHVLRENVARLEAAHQQRADVADHRRDPVARAQRVGRAYGNGFLPQAAVQAADDFVLPEQAHQQFLERAVEPQVVVELEGLFARERQFIEAAFVVRTSRDLAARRAPTGVRFGRSQPFVEFAAMSPRPSPSRKLRQTHRSDAPSTSAARHRPAQQLLERSGAAIGDAARHDQIEIAQIGGDVVGKAVRRDPAADVHADGAELFFGRR